MSIRDWPKNERPREKLIERGAQGLSEAELLAVLLGSGVRGRSAVELARHLLMEFGSLRALLSLERARFMSQRGLGPTRYCVMQAALELGRRHYREAMYIGSVLTAPEATRAFLMTQLRDRAYEVFCCLHLDNRHRLISFEELFRGTIDGASVHPREVVKQALSHNAAAVIFAHNIQAESRSRATPTSSSRAGSRMRSRSSTFACSIISSSATASACRSQNRDSSEMVSRQLLRLVLPRFGAGELHIFGRRLCSIFVNQRSARAAVAVLAAIRVGPSARLTLCLKRPSGRPRLHEPETPRLPAFARCPRLASGTESHEPSARRPGGLRRNDPRRSAAGDR